MAAAIVLPFVLFALASWQSHRLTLADARVRAERTARLLQEHALKVLDTQRLVIAQIRDRLRTMDWTRDGDLADLHQLLARVQSETDQVTTISVIDAAGRMRASARVFPADPRISFAHREWFDAIKNGNGSTIFVSRPITGRQTGRGIFSVTMQAPPDRAGQFDGAISASIDQGYFESFYRDVESGAENSVTLARDDGAILVREPKTDRDDLAPSADALRSMQSGTAGSYTAVSSLDGIERIYAYRKVADYPVYVRFGVSTRAALAPWYNDLRIYGLTAFIASLALVAAAALALRQTAREAAARRNWAAVASELRTEVAERGRVEAQLRQAQKMEAVGRLTGGIAHDFNNLLTVVIGSLDLVHRRLTTTDSRSAQLISNAMEGANRAAALTQRLLAFSRQQPLSPKRVDPNRLVADMSDLLRRTLSAEVRMETVLAAGLWPTLADPNQLESAILNLAVNARDAMADGGRLTIETANVFLDEAYAAAQADVAAGPYVMIAVADTGQGMPPDVIAQVCEPFFTTKPVGKGTGLGLSQVYGFVKQSGGHLAIYSEVGVGTTVKLYLPRLRAAEQVGNEAIVTPAPASVRGSGTILVVEDNAAVRSFSVAALQEAGFDVLEAADGPAGLRLAEAEPSIALLFTDVVLGGAMDGRVLADAVAARRPGLPVLFTTGYTRNAIVHHGRLDDGVNFIGKPFTAVALTAAVGQLLATAGASPDAPRDDTSPGARS